MRYDILTIVSNVYFAVTAGIHNAEYVGIQAAIELSSEIDPEYLAGALIIVPLANTSGFENRTLSMVYEDGKNLNHVFPGDENGTAADRLAHLIFNTFIRHPLGLMVKSSLSQEDIFYGKKKADTRFVAETT